MKPNLAIIGASYLQLPLIIKAKEMGYVTHVFAWKADDVGEFEADFFYPISIVEKERILDECKKIGIVGICSIASDLAIITVNYVANALGLTGNSIRCTNISTNKYLMRQAFEQNGDPIPWYLKVDLNTDLTKITYPAIVKPTDRSGSRGVCRVDDYISLKKAINVALNQSIEKKVIVEEFIEGEEYSVEYISFRGCHYFLGITKKYTTGAPHFIEKGHLEPALLSDSTITKIKKIVEHALNSLEVQNGASHSEIKIRTDGSIVIIEIGARMGGDCIGSDLIMYSTGYDYVKMVVSVATGNCPEFSKVCTPRHVESIFIFNEKDLDELNELKSKHPEYLIKIVDLHPEKIGHTRDSSNRAGCYIRIARQE
ncbi:ATP-grasp domain-containing protein [Succinivibrio dextrinosolvens DSM 3072]|uniref:ATP-grasp domain-containing protein n=1 Tax=Succinivibrio dextrinosolvens DSM 3072 TaxID=1123324 RepID=A0A1T4VBP7_9GAMM|nr:ATP-grasp domain-containing protein [Succinivibrio dextrinosolvens]SKA62366.1 ATP-grasp domain-containing protein [Succinivibrio dextrinosolvens DSM 3072]